MFAAIRNFFLASTEYVEPPGPAPDGPPTMLWGDKQGGGDDPPTGKILLSWVNGDPAAYTRIYIDQVPPGTPDYIVDPGETMKSTDATWEDDHDIYATHYKNGQESASDYYDHQGGRPT
jgi:hypothetical protein